MVDEGFCNCVDVYLSPLAACRVSPSTTTIVSSTQGSRYESVGHFSLMSYVCLMPLANCCIQCD